MFLCTIYYKLHSRLDLNIEHLENLCIEIRKPRAKSFLVTTWYRPPDSTVGKFCCFEMLVGKFDAGGIEYYLMGDINVSLAAPYSDNFLTWLTDTPLFAQSMHDRDVLKIKPIGSS